MKKLRICVFSHIRLFSESLSLCLNASNEVAEVLDCYKADCLVEEVVGFKPHVLLIDFSFENALKEARAVKDILPETIILALALPEQADKVIACADAGLSGYISRRSSMSGLVGKLIEAIKGKFNCSPSIAGGLFREIQRRQQISSEGVTVEPLTQRESTILRLLGRGLSNKKIASELHISVATVKNHVHNIFTKLHIHSRGEALALLRNEPWLAKSA